KADAVNEAKGYIDTTTSTAKNDAIAAAKGYTDNAKKEAIADAYETTTRAMNRVAEYGRPGGTYAGTDSYAAGKESKATGVNSVALGANSRATRDNEVNIGSWVYKPAEPSEQPAPKRLNRSDFAGQGTYVQSTRTLSGVSDGKKDDEAVNLKQLNDVASTAKSAATTAKNEAIRDANKYTDEATLKANEKVLKEANTYTDDTAKKTLKTANEHTERRAVVAENNAVTRSNAYTDESSSRTLERANTYTNHRSAQAENNAVARSNAYTNKRFGELKNQVDRNEKRANGGIAGAMAMNGIPAGSGFGMAVGGYRDQGAIAIGMQKKINSDTTVSLKAAWDSGNGTGVSAGFLVDW
ncbi:hypothetical protein E1550_22430, partial [Salmonella enterica subsp. enterica serovar Adelaide]|nr:hypothetical protein [Salmonella enterica subsp. enterica serovar Adelaide]ECF2140132.1 hypothetical protein [Salmonella enterica subsp. enterica serovar Adelaide]EDA8261184.1 hypothetical protein [Salmonella enterica subsp. enterica serovar Adelaide]